MKKLSILLLLLVLCVATLFAQAPEKLSYQAVVRNASNQLISNAPVGVRVSILQGGVNGMMVYMETHTAVTNANGLVTLQIGGGTVQQGVFADIDWANGPFFLKTETDHAGGSNYTVTSTQQLLSVPYALYAKEAGNVPQNVGELTNDVNYITLAQVPAQVNADWDATNGAAQILNKPTDVSAFTNDAGYITGYTETQTLADVTAQGNSAGNRQLKNVSDPTDPQDAVTKTYLDQLVNNLTGLVQNLLQQVDSLQNVVDALTGGSTIVTQPTVTTSAATNITSTSATLNGSISNPDEVAITTQGFEWKATAGGAYVAVNATGETMTYNLTGLTAGTSYTYRAFVTTAEGTSYGGEVVFTTTASGSASFTCGTSKMVDADGNEYETVQVGTQCWTKTNLRSTKAADGSAIPAGGSTTSYTVPYYYVNSAVNPAVYGYYYNWEAAKLACPTGWHLPSDAEWTQLTDYVSGQSEYICSGNSNNIAKALASTEGWNSYSGECYPGDQSVTANNATGFSAVPAGTCNGSSFDSAGNLADFWSSTQDNSDDAWSRLLYYYRAGVYRYSSRKNYGRSVRCLRD